MAGRLLFKTTDRDEAHRQLAKSLVVEPTAECREDPNDSTGQFQVWSGPADYVVQPPILTVTAQEATSGFDELAAKVAAQVLAALTKGAGNGSR